MTHFILTALWSLIQPLVVAFLAGCALAAFLSPVIWVIWVAFS